MAQVPSFGHFFRVECVRVSVKGNRLVEQKPAVTDHASWCWTLQEHPQSMSRSSNGQHLLAITVLVRKRLAIEIALHELCYNAYHISSISKNNTIFIF